MRRIFLALSLLLSSLSFAETHSAAQSIASKRPIADGLTYSDAKFDRKVAQLRDELDKKLWFDEEKLGKFHEAIDGIADARKRFQKQKLQVDEARLNLKALIEKKKNKLTKAEAELISRIGEALDRLIDAELEKVDVDFLGLALEGRALSKLKAIQDRYTVTVEHDFFGPGPGLKDVIATAPFLFGTH